MQVVVVAAASDDDADDADDNGDHDLGDDDDELWCLLVVGRLAAGELSSFSASSLASVADLFLDTSSTWTCIGNWL